MLRQVAEGVLIHQSEFCQSNAVVVHGRAGVLLIDPGIQGSEMACLANDAYVHALRDAGVPSDRRVGPSATFGKDWLPGVHERQLQQLARRTQRDGTPG